MTQSSPNRFAETLLITATGGQLNSHRGELLLTYNLRKRMNPELVALVTRPLLDAPQRNAYMTFSADMQRAHTIRLLHTIAILTLGWYLLLPPVGCEECEPNTVAPLALWEHFKSYDSASKCERGQEKLLLNAEKLAAKRSDMHAARTAKRYSLGRCIGTDDPRLKPN
jgi:hypothetical protein